MTARHRIIRRVLGIEGDYSDHASDRGGKTRFGITEATARRNGYIGSMQDLPLPFAIGIYERDYWFRLRLDQIELLSPMLAEELFDTAVNMGPGTAVKFLQRALNALSQRFALFERLTIDGNVGVKTLAALRLYMGKRGGPGAKVLVRLLDSQQGARYLALAEADETQQDFMFGWALHRLANAWADAVTQVARAKA